MRYAVIFLLVIQTSCVTFLAGNMGAGATAVTVAEAVDTAKTAGDVVAYGTTGKTLTDMLWTRLQVVTVGCLMFLIVIIKYVENACPNCELQLRYEHSKSQKVFLKQGRLGL